MDRISPDLNPDSAEQDAGSQRGNVRDSLFLAARFRVKGAAEAESVRIRNLSPGGVMVELPEPIDLDTLVEVDVRGIGWIAGKVAWTTEGRAGIAFDKPIDPLRARKPVGQGEKTPAFVKPILRKR